MSHLSDPTTEHLPKEIYQGEEHSEWVQQHLVEFSKLTGVSIEGFEVEAMNLFVAIEKRWRNIGGADTISKDPHKKP